MSGKTFLIGFGAIFLVFTALLWWTQTRAFYTEVAGLETISVAGRDIAVADYRGIDATSSPIKLRACMTVDPASIADETPVDTATPLIAPSWFECFDAGALTRALKADEAAAYLAAEEEHDGVDRMLAVFPDGRAYMWRQLNEKYAE